MGESGVIQGLSCSDGSQKTFTFYQQFVVEIVPKVAPTVLQFDTDT